MTISLKKALGAVLAAALLLGAAPASAAVDTEVQLGTIANADEVWDSVLEQLAEDDSRYMRFSVHHSPTLDIAVTDLDANGRSRSSSVRAVSQGKGPLVHRKRTALRSIYRH